MPHEGGLDKYFGLVHGKQPMHIVHSIQGRVWLTPFRGESKLMLIRRFTMTTLEKSRCALVFDSVALHFHIIKSRFGWFHDRFCDNGKTLITFHFTRSNGR